MMTAEYETTVIKLGGYIMKHKINGSLIGGLILLIGGILALISQFLSDSMSEFFATYILLGLGLVFITAGILTREDGWFIPGGILTGLGSGIVLLTGPWADRLPGDEGGWFLLLFSAGFFLITIMTAIFTEETHWWAAIPGSIIGLVALAVLYGGVFMNALEWLGKLWPLALILAGIAILWKMRHHSADEDEKPLEKHT